MTRLCERPGCSEPGAAAYGMRPEDLVFWLSPLDRWNVQTSGVLCRRHADAMVVPRGWTLDDRREPVPRLFRPPPAVRPATAPRPRRRPVERTDEPAGEQLELGADSVADPPATPAVHEPTVAEGAAWMPSFDTDDDLDGLLEVRSPLLSRAFRGAGRGDDGLDQRGPRRPARP